ncbi:MAG: DUF134 domain-containing protein [Patescibacteria group bacterium]|nr:DUF134 domain-containing protein [Patescibacteria group bacterium]
MPRPRMCRRVKFNPQITYFKPQGISMRDLEVINLSLEEIEAYRLRHVDKLDQKESARKMKTSASTYQRIIYSAYEKIADALTNGKAIRIS